MIGRQLVCTSLYPYPCNSEVPEIEVTGSQRIISKKVMFTGSGGLPDCFFVSERRNVSNPNCNGPTVLERWESLVVGIWYLGESTSNLGEMFTEDKWVYQSNVILSGLTANIKNSSGKIIGQVGAKARQYTYTHQGATGNRTYEYWEDVNNYKTAITSCVSPLPGSGYSCTNFVENFGADVITVKNAPIVPVSKGNIVLKYLPVAAGDVVALTVSILAGAAATGPWTVALAGNSVVISNTSGTTYTFTGTLPQIASSINSTGGGTLFSASGSTGIDEDPQPKDLLSIRASSNNNCLFKGYLKFAGDEVCPAGISQAPWDSVETFQQAVNSGEYSDTHDGFKSWISSVFKPRFPEWITTTYSGEIYIGPVAHPYLGQINTDSPINFYGGTWLWTRQGSGASSVSWETVWPGAYTNSCTQSIVYTDCYASGGVPCYDNLPPCPPIRPFRRYEFAYDCNFIDVPEVRGGFTWNLEGEWKYAET